MFKSTMTETKTIKMKIKFKEEMITIINIYIIIFGFAD